MRKRIGIIILLFTMVFVFVSNSGQPIKYIAEKDGVIEWQSYSSEELS